MKDWMKYQLIIVDMDGTLYFQRPVQLRMGLRMIVNAFFGKHGFRELKVTLKYRKLREKWPITTDSDMEQAQYEQLAAETGLGVQAVYDIIQKWIFQKPLDLLPIYADRKLIGAIGDLIKSNIPVVIYSDYPVTDKARTLGLSEIKSYHGGQSEIGCMKPSPEGIKWIMQDMGISDPAQVLVIGDRMSKDGQAALNAGVDYVILAKSKGKRMKATRYECSRSKRRS